jgi:glycosyltransferase involved in cell wall biosynthesis
MMEISFGFTSILSGKLRGEKVVLVSPAMLSSALSLAWIRIRRPKTKVILWVQDLYEQGIKETYQKIGFLSQTIFKIENWLLKNVDRVVMAHPGFLEAKRLSEGDSKRYLAIPNWSQFTFKPTHSMQKTRELYDFRDSKVVLHIGNMGVKQGLENVIEAAKISQSQGANSLFVFVGGGNQLERLKQEALGVENIVFIPPVSEVELSNVLQAADILLVNELPGVKEMSIPSKLTTYFLSGKPVLVCSEVESLAAKTVLENGTGFWVKSGDPSALIQKLDTLELDESRKVAEVAKKYAEENLRKDEALAKFLSIINDF